MKNCCFLVAIVLFISLTTFGQTTEFVKNDGITSSIHKENVGTIAFMEKTIPIENFKQTDFLTSFEMKEKSDLSIRVFLGTSLTNYLHVLSPELTAEELTKNGNYQFTFMVDNKKIYVENLNIGAGSVENKNQRTVFRVPLMSTTNEDSWGKFLWNRFIANGGQDAFSTGEHLLKIEIRPYLQSKELLSGEIIAEGTLQIIIPEIKVDEKLVKIQTIQPIKGWELSSDTITISKIEALNKKIASRTFKDITSIVIVKEGKLLLEEYFNGAKRNSLHDMRSVGKSFASTLMGIAIEEQYIKSENQTLNDFYTLKNFKNYSPEKERITLKSLLTMSAPFDGSDIISESPGNEENMYPTPNWVEFTLNLPVDKTKFEKNRWDYFTAGVVVLGDILHKSVPDGLAHYSDKKLFKPLGITNYKWEFTPQKVANTAGGIRLSSLDFAKYGQLYKNNGVWNGKQLLTKAWVEKSLSKQMTISEGEYYGYLFWNKTYTVNGKNYEVYYCSGNGGNKIIIFKDQPIVMVVTATAYNTPFGHKQVDKIVADYLISAVMN